MWLAPVYYILLYHICALNPPKSLFSISMERYDIQWEQKGTHEKHLSVLDYKKQEREKEIAALDSTLAEKQNEDVYKRQL